MVGSAGAASARRLLPLRAAGAETSGLLLLRRSPGRVVSVLGGRRAEHRLGAVGAAAAGRVPPGQGRGPAQGLRQEASLLAPCVLTGAVLWGEEEGRADRATSLSSSGIPTLSDEAPLGLSHLKGLPGTPSPSPLGEGGFSTGCHSDTLATVVKAERAQARLSTRETSGALGQCCGLPVPRKRPRGPPLLTPSSCLSHPAHLLLTLTHLCSHLAISDHTVLASTAHTPLLIPRHLCSHPAPPPLTHLCSHAAISDHTQPSPFTPSPSPVMLTHLCS